MGYKMSFEIPVSVNRMYMHHSLKSVILTDEARNWKLLANIMAKNQWGYEPPLEGNIRVDYYFCGSRLDADNGLKLLNDALNKIVWKDDRQITEMHVYVIRKDKNPRVEIEVFELS